MWCPMSELVTLFLWLMKTHQGVHGLWDVCVTSRPVAMVWSDQWSLPPNPPDLRDQSLWLFCLRAHTTIWNITRITGELILAVWYALNKRALFVCWYPVTMCILDRLGPMLWHGLKWWYWHVSQVLPDIKLTWTLHDNVITVFRGHWQYVIQVMCNQHMIHISTNAMDIMWDNNLIHSAYWGSNISQVISLNALNMKELCCYMVCRYSS